MCPGWLYREEKYGLALENSNLEVPGWSKLAHRNRNYPKSRRYGYTATYIPTSIPTCVHMCTT
jgi:hypothetical protein